MKAKQILPVPLEREAYQLKERLVKNVFDHISDKSLHTQIQMVANDALTTASLTPLPLLVLPFIFEEKVEAVFEAHGKKDKLLSLAA
jgi:hypothetical protein